MIAAAWLVLNSLLYSLQLQTGSFPKPLTQEEEEDLLARSAKGDLEARNTLIERNLRLVAHIMKKYYAQTADQEDLISIGTIGLIKGVTTFDPSKGARLATYAARCVENEILMYFRGQKKSGQDVSLSDYMTRQVCKAINTVLTEQERTVILLRYGLGGHQACRQREVAQKIGLSRSYVSRIEKKALQKLRSALE